MALVAQIEIVPTNRGGTKLRYQNYLYRLHSKKLELDTIYWKCDTPGCYGKLRTDFHYLNPIASGEHGHDIVDNTQIEIKRARTEMKQLVEMQPHMSTGQVR